MEMEETNNMLLYGIKSHY
uniref:Uncharacterized protein n=1 Tax=Anguilla anguilla TaxID=7936 RepID=A0A0E9TTS6_ANGAN